MPKRASQMRTRSSRVKAERPPLWIGAVQNHADQLGLLVRFQALAGGRRSSNRKGHRGRAHYSGSPSPLRSGGPYRPPPRRPSGSYPKGHWRSQVAAAPRACWLRPWPACVRPLACDRLLWSAPSSCPPSESWVGNHDPLTGGIAAEQQEFVFRHTGMTDLSANDRAHPGYAAESV